MVYYDDTDVWGYLPKTPHFMNFIQLGMYSTGITQNAQVVERKEQNETLGSCRKWSCHLVS